MKLRLLAALLSGSYRFQLLLWIYISLCVAVAVSLGDIGAVGHTREVGLLATRELLRYLKVIHNPAEFARTSIDNFVKQLWGRSNVYMKLKHRPSETRNCFDSPFGFSSVGLSLHGLPTVMKYSRWPACLHKKYIRLCITSVVIWSSIHTQRYKRNNVKTTNVDCNVYCYCTWSKACKETCGPPNSAKIPCKTPNYRHVLHYYTHLSLNMVYAIL